MKNENLTQEEIMENQFFKSGRVFNLAYSELDTPIYRVYKSEHLLKMITNKENSLVHISRWEDPFEAFILKQKIYDRGIPVDVRTFYDPFYGQCWSLNQTQSDATWRIYSPEGNRILVKTTLRKLWDGFYNSNYSKAMISYALGKVLYEAESKIVNDFNGISFSTDILDSSLSQLINTVLIKRLEFTHENEVRILFFDHDKLASNGIVSYSIDPVDFIEELIADPRIDDVEFGILRTTLENKGFGITKSTLYQLPNLNLKL